MPDDATADAQASKFFGECWQSFSDRDRMVWQNARKSDLHRHLNGVTDAIAAVLDRKAALYTLDDQIKYLTARLAFIRQCVQAAQARGRP